jgi:hypothetical protein
MNGSSLPVAMTNFTAEKQVDKTVLVKWQTASEVNNSHFIIEHSTDGSMFNQLELVKGAGNNSTVKNYSYIHNNPIDGINYYRLTQVDFDGTKHESYVIAINMSEEQLGTVTLFPVPANEVLNISFNNTQFNGSVNVKIYDIVGREVMNKQLGVNNKKQVSSIDISNLNKGSYFINIASQNGAEQKIKFIKD